MSIRLGERMTEPRYPTVGADKAGGFSPDLVTTLLDLVGLVALAVGLGFAAGYLIGWAGIAVTGVVLLAGARVIEWLAVPGSAPSWWQRLRQRKAEGVSP